MNNSATIAVFLYILSLPCFAEDFIDSSKSIEAFEFAKHYFISNFDGDKKCPEDIQLPEISCSNLSLMGKMTRGYYLHGSGRIIIDNSVCGSNEGYDYIAHESMHYMQEKCVYDYSEDQAYEVQYAYDGN